MTVDDMRCQVSVGCVFIAIDELDGCG